MKALLAAVNAKYPHTNIAVRSIAAWSARHGGVAPRWREWNINQPRRRILRELWEEEADVYLFSCYLWNIGLVRALAEELRLIRPDAVIILGGPEVSWNAEETLQAAPAADIVIRGEGEETAAQLLRHLAGGKPLDGVDGISWRNNGTVVHNRDRTPPDPDALPFPYENLGELRHRVLYYESMRGCPFQCSYCVSSIQRGLRLRSLELVFRDLDRFLEAEPPQVKFVDRTFNCDNQRARAIWSYLMERDNGVTRFHFELAGDLLDDASLELLSQARPGLLELEIGVQSTHQPTLEAIRRVSDLERLTRNVERLRQRDNLHLHLDLIAGLPYEDYHHFRQSFDTVYRMRPHRLQLGFLKVLPGSQMKAEAERHGIRYRPAAPYEVLQTRWLSYSELEELHGVDDMVDLYCNSGRFDAMMAYVERFFPSPFAMLHALWRFYDGETGEGGVSKMRPYEILGGFLLRHGIAAGEEAQWVCRYDLLRHEKPKAMPGWVTVDSAVNHRDAVRGFFADSQMVERYLPDYRGVEPRRLSRLVHLEVFPFHPETGEPGETPLLFDYARRDILGRAQVRRVTGMLPQTEAL